MSAPKLLLHACCAPCASSVLEKLVLEYKVSIFFCNPNIQPIEEYQKRLAQFAKLQKKFEFEMITAAENFSEWQVLTDELKNEPEGGKRCQLCYEYRLAKAAQYAVAGNYDSFATTLTLSPHKDHKIINLLGQKAAEQYKVPYLASNFKKENGYQRSILLSREMGIYRQNYCGCLYSLGNR